MTAPELAFRSGVSIGSIAKYMNGSRTPTLKKLEPLARALGRSLSDFHAENPPEAKPFVAPAFGLRVLDEKVDSDLRRQAEQAIDDVNREYLRRLESGRPPRPRTYVTDMVLPSSPLEGKRARTTFSEGMRAPSGAEPEAEQDEVVPPRRRSSEEKSQSPRRSR